MPDTNATLDEVSLRSPRFRGGEPVALGEPPVTFFLPKPNVQYRAKFSRGKVVESTPQTDLGPDFDEALAALDADEPDGDGDGADDGDGNTAGKPKVPFLDRLQGLGAALLLFNYDLDDDTLGRLLIFKAADEDNQEIWKAIAGTARGTYAPKATSGTSGSAS